jgi:hypothetical protein
MTYRTNDDDALQGALKQAIQPITGELDRDLWPEMVHRLEAPQKALPWLDLIMASATVVLLAITPSAIPLLTYQL